MFSLKINLILEAMRPVQWLKNGLIFMALVFSKSFFEPEAVSNSVLAFIVFSMVSGAVYLINDIVDREKDREHPLKDKRPIASGRLPAGSAWTGAAVISGVSLVAAFAINPSFGLITVAYFALFNLYTFVLKAVPIVDILTVASGFAVRAAAGALAIEVEISPWLLLCTMLMALFVVLGKRRHEIVVLGDRATVLTEYNSLFLDQMIAVVTASTLVAYSVYTVSAETVEKFGTDNLKYTVPFVLYGIFRHLYLIYKKEAGVRPERDILADTPTIVNIFLWIGAVLGILYAG
ncbi:MAG: decaprenyl-phosphate phosphoribosyltransferase [Thermodesulfobacteriota bacterium]